MQKLVEDFIKANPGYLKKSPAKVALKINVDLNYENLAYIKNIMRKIRKFGFEDDIKKPEINIKPLSEAPKELKDKAINLMLEHYLSNNNYDAAINVLNRMKEKEQPKSRVLVIGDIHEPFCLDGYLEFCKEQYKKYNCNRVVFIGDIIDQHFSSFHPTDPDGYGAGEELDRAIEKIQEWYKAFPEATVVLGNHDRLAYRKAYSGGISSRWLRSYGDVLGTPNWNFDESISIDNILYIHGESGTARTKAKDIAKSVVQGHLHSQAYIEYINNNIFAFQVGTGIDDNCYAFNYNKAGKESIISCGVVLEGQPILIRM